MCLLKIIRCSEPLGEPLAYIGHFGGIWPEVMCDWATLEIYIPNKNTAVVEKYFIKIFRGKERRKLNYD